MAGYTLGSLLIEIAMNNPRLQTDMAAAKRIVQGGMGDVRKAIDLAKTGLVFLTGIGSLAAFKGMVESGIEAKAALADLTAQTGDTVESFSALVRVGEYSRTTGEDIAAAMNKLTKGLAGVDEETKGAARGIGLLGLNLKEFQALAPGEQLRQVATALSGFRDGSEKSAIAMALLGKSGAQLLPFLKELAERSDTVATTTAESAKQAKQFEDNIVALKIAGDAWKKTIVDAMLPSLVDLTDQMAKAHNTGDRLRALWDNFLGNARLDGLSRQRKELEQLGHTIEYTEFQLSEMLKGQKAEPYNRSYSEGVVRLQSELEALRARAAAASEALKSAANIASPLQIFNDRRTSNPNDDKRKLNVGGLGDDAIKAEAEYQKLMGTINLFISQKQAELDAGKELTEGQRLQVKVLEELDNAKRKLTVSQKLNADANLQFALAISNEKDVLDRDLKWLEESRQENQRILDQAYEKVSAYEDEIKQLKLQGEEYGLNAEQVDRLRVSRTRDIATRLDERAAALRSSPAHEDLVRLYGLQAERLREIAKLNEERIAREHQEHYDPLTGASKGIKDYLDEVARAGDATRDAVTGAARMAEDTLVDTFAKGKLDASRFIDYVIAEFLRLQIVRPLMQSLLSFGGGGGGLGGIFGAVGGLFGGGEGSTPTLDAGLSIPGMSGIASAGSGFAQVASAGISVVQHIYPSPGVSPADLSVAMKAAKSEAVSEITEAVRRRPGVFA